MREGFRLKELNLVRLDLIAMLLFSFALLWLRVLRCDGLFSTTFLKHFYWLFCLWTSIFLAWVLTVCCQYYEIAVSILGLIFCAINLAQSFCGQAPGPGA